MTDAPAPAVSPDARALLRNLEAACDDLAANRSRETYHNMVHCDRATPYLEALDEARRQARAYLATQSASDTAIPAQRFTNCNGYGHVGCGVCSVCTGAAAPKVVSVPDTVASEVEPCGYCGRSACRCDRSDLCEASGCDNPTDCGICDDCDQWVTDTTAIVLREVPPELRALSDRATPGPWAWEQCGEKEDAPVIGVAFPGDDHDCKAPYEGEFRDSDASRMTIAYDWQACDGHSPSANAAFVVAAVNYVRTMLAAAPEVASEGAGLREALRASLAKRSQATMDPPYTAAFNAALDMVAKDVSPFLFSNATDGAAG